MADGAGFLDEWTRCRPWIEAALERGGDLYDMAHVERMIAEEAAHFWPGKRCAAVTQIVGTKNRAINFWLLGGDLKELVNDMRPAIEAWAKALGCTKATGVFFKGRRGWVRTLEKHGYGPFFTGLSKEL